jgi:23S rRNA (cytidine1920-2'-O)/16S rRNA (cytidine1409-2'-O)-methyltransferase
VVALVKPQFEAGAAEVGKGGVVRDPAVHRRVLEGALQGAREAGLVPAGLTASPIKGEAGNVEFLLWARRPADSALSGAPALPELDGGAAVGEALAEAAALASLGRGRS